MAQLVLLIAWQPSCVRGAPLAAPAVAGLALPDGNGSSIVRIASERPPAYSLLVTAVFRKIVTLDCGIGCPPGVNVPPVQFKSKSPTNSAIPSARTIGGTPAFAVHVNAGLFCA